MTMTEKTPEVTLLTATDLPLETVYSVWMASKNDDPLLTPEWVRDNVPREEVEDLFRRVIAQRIPIGEHIDIVFMLSNVSVSWREQACRHRIGNVIAPERLGIDIVPDLANSSWWSQSMRILNMGNFATNGAYRMPEAVLAKGPAAIEQFRQTMLTIEESYNDLVASGVPMEDARELMPLGAQHRISWKLNIGALQHIIGKRACWILQAGLWGPVIMGMIEELATKVHPIFRELATPPCIKRDSEGNDNFAGCVFHEECNRRYTGEDDLPPCPLHLVNHHAVAEGWLKEPFHVVAPIQVGQDGARLLRQSIVNQAKRDGVPRIADMIERGEYYRLNFWGRDPYTGAKEQ